ncbi:hypothetical protein [Carboxylicivirga marina]|nr:hypothetical protein [uncultured Carboxylicivirga sp.]
MKKLVFTILIILSVIATSCGSYNKMGAIDCPQSYYGAGNRTH